MRYNCLQVLVFTSIALWTISGVVSYVGCWLFFGERYFQQWTSQMFSYTIFTFTSLIFGECAKSIGRYCRKLSRVQPRAVSQETAIDEDHIGLLIADETEPKECVFNVENTKSNEKELK